MLAHRRVRRSLTDASLSLACWCILVAHSPPRPPTNVPLSLACRRDLSSTRTYHVTVATSSGKPFDRQSALDLRAGALLTGLSFAHRRVRHSLTAASLSLAYRCLLVAHLPTCHRHGNATATMSSGKPFDRQSSLALRADASLNFLDISM